MSAKASGAKAQPNGNATNRSHHDGSSTRAYTVDQKDAVIRIRKCGATSFYDILGLESERKTVTSGGIKKAYHKLSLLTHPDKNGYPGADEAFKMVSRAFQILSDTDKKSRYDQFGGDPDARFSSSSASSGAASNPFAGFARANAANMRPGAGGPAFEAEMSPEELFRQFFGGGFGGGGGFDGGFGGPQFFFSGPGGFRVHQFGGTRPRRRPPGTGDAQDAQQQPPSAGAMLMNLLPILLFFLLPLLSSLFSGASNWASSTPAFRPPPFSIDRPRPPDLTSERTTARLGVPFFFDARAAAAFDKPAWAAFDRAVEARLLSTLNRDCAAEREQRTALAERAYGWFSVDRDMLARADALPMPACGRLDGFRGRLGASY